MGNSLYLEEMSSEQRLFLRTLEDRLDFVTFAINKNDDPKEYKYFFSLGTNNEIKVYLDSKEVMIGFFEAHEHFYFDEDITVNWLNESIDLVRSLISHEIEIKRIYKGNKQVKYEINTISVTGECRTVSSVITSLLGMLNLFRKAHLEVEHTRIILQSK